MSKKAVIENSVEATNSELELDNKTTALEVASKQFATITSDEQCQAANSIRKDIKALLGDIDETFDPIIKAAHQSHKKALEQKKKHAAPLERIESFLDNRIKFYLRAQKEAQEREERRLQKLAKDEAEKRRIEEAAQLIEEGRDEEAGELLEQKIEIGKVATIPISKSVAVSGVRTAYSYSAEVVNLVELVKAVVSGSVAIDAIQPNQVFLNAQARVLRDEFESSYPGCKLIKS